MPVLTAHLPKEAGHARRCGYFPGCLQAYSTAWWRLTPLAVPTASPVFAVALPAASAHPDVVVMLFLLLFKPLTTAPSTCNILKVTSFQ